MKNLPVLRTLTEKVRLQDTNRNCGSTVDHRYTGQIDLPSFIPKGKKAYTRCKMKVCCVPIKL